MAVKIKVTKQYNRLTFHLVLLRGQAAVKNFDWDIKLMLHINCILIHECIYFFISLKQYITHEQFHGSKNEGRVTD